MFWTDKQLREENGRLKNEILRLKREKNIVEENHSSYVRATMNREREFYRQIAFLKDKDNLLDKFFNKLVDKCVSFAEEE